MIQKIIFNISLFLLILIAPWWLSALVALFGLYFFRTFNELILFGVVFDILYGHQAEVFWLINYKFTLISLFFLLTSFLIKSQLRFYRH